MPQPFRQATLAARSAVAAASCSGTVSCSAVSAILWRKVMDFWMENHKDMFKWFLFFWCCYPLMDCL
jgi:hypothetical protein